MCVRVLTFSMRSHCARCQFEASSSPSSASITARSRRWALPGNLIADVCPPCDRRVDFIGPGQFFSDRVSMLLCRLARKLQDGGGFALLVGVSWDGRAVGRGGGATHTGWGGFGRCCPSTSLMLLQIGAFDCTPVWLVRGNRKWTTS